MRRKKAYKCSFCDKSFSQGSNLKTHQKDVHYKAKPFKCDTCGKLFQRNNALKIHVKVQHQGIRFKCNYCLEEFAHPGNLRKHKVNIHSETK